MPTPKLDQDPALPRGFNRKSDQRFWHYVVKQAGCWRWNGAVDNDGYGQFWTGQKNIRAHRAAWMLVNGEVAPGVLVRHFVCDNPNCVNPDHLELGDHSDNMSDMVIHRRSMFGRRHHAVKLSDDVVRNIRATYAAGGVSQRGIAKAFGISRSTAFQMLNRKTWRHVA